MTNGPHRRTTSNTDAEDEKDTLESSRTHFAVIDDQGAVVEPAQLEMPTQHARVRRLKKQNTTKRKVGQCEPAYAPTRNACRHTV